MTIVDSLWRHNDTTRSQGQAFCLLTLEFKCHLQYCSSQEVDGSLSLSAVLHYIDSGNGLVPSGNKPLPELMMTKISDTTSMG